MSPKKILLIQPLHEKAHLKRGERGSFNFPYGIGSIAAVLENNGFEVKVLDVQAEQIEKEEVAERIKNTDFDILGISAFSTQYNRVRELADFVKTNLKEKIIVVGGALATHSAKLTIETTLVDFCVIGEGEKTIIDLLSNLDNYENVKGIAFKKDNQIIFTPERPYIENLDDLPRPAYHLFPIEKYLKYNSVAGGYGLKSKRRFRRPLRAMSLITQRGCPYRCGFCSRNFSGARFMSAKRVIEEIKFLKEKYNLECIHISDELFLTSKARVEEFLPMIKDLKITWFCQGRVNLVNEELLKKMKDAGCVCIGYGIESGSQRILDDMKKDTTIKQIEDAMLMAKRINLHVKVQLIFGYPGEDENSVQETIDLFKRVKHPARRFNYIVPLPGSEIYEDALAEGRIKDEAEYLKQVEVGGGHHKVLVNYTPWPDERVMEMKKRAEKAMLENYYKRNIISMLNHYVFENVAAVVWRNVKKYIPK